MPIINDNSPSIRTGLTSARISNLKRHRKATAVPQVNNPVLNYVIGQGQRASTMDTRPPFDVNAIRNGYLVDSYIRQGVDKYVELIIKEGWRFEGDPEIVRFVEKRLSMITLMSGEPWELVIERGIRDFIKYGNMFLYIQRTHTEDPIPGMKLFPLAGKNPVGAYFNLPVHQLSPVLDQNGNVTGWEQATQRQAKVFPVRDVLHFAYSREPGGIWGIPYTIEVIEDVRALRQCEENVLKLIYKNLNPLIHQETPDITGTGEGRQEDVDDAVRNFQEAAPDGFVVTPPGYKISIVGAESKALRAEGYLEIFRKRVFSGLGVSELVMGENVGAPAGTADALIDQMYFKVKTFQSILARYFTIFIINELLLEGGYDPWNRREDQVTWIWNEIEIDRKIKEATHVLNLWTMNLISSDEARTMIGLTETPDWEDFYVHQVQIPQVVAAKIGVDPEDESADASGSSDQHSVSLPKTGGQASNIISPSNKITGPRAKANAPTAHKMSSDAERILEKRLKRKADRDVEA